ncbi:DNA polymerase subunit Cdc27-domain-containing protein [Scleroderma yunnanense]
MTTQAAQDYLTKEIFIRHSVVTFRSLSRELSIHVNDAKNELKEFYEASRFTDSPAVPTYLVSGEVASKTGGSKPFSSTPDADEYYMDVDFEDDAQEKDVVYMNKVMLVDAKVLDETMTQFLRVFSVHIYSLSPSRLTDPALICATNVNVQKVDAARGPELFAIVGKISGAHVKMRAAPCRGTATTASSSKTTLDTVKREQPTKAPPQVAPEQPAIKVKASAPGPKDPNTTAMHSLRKGVLREKSMTAGKLDWSKGKTKEKAKGADPPKDDLNPESSSSKIVSVNKPPAALPNRPSVDAGSSSKLSTNKLGANSAGQGGASAQRGMKRKSQIPSDSEDDVPVPSKPAASSGTAKVRGGVVISDEEDDISVPRRRRAKAKGVVTSDTETSLRAMMDIDDEQVVKVSRLSKVRPQLDMEAEPETEAEEDTVASVPPLSSDADDMDVDDEPIVKPKKRQPRKVVPVGRNGLKKKRVVKTRTTTDAKGYIQTEDYSSYESVKEEDTQTEQPAKGKGKKKNTDQPKVEEQPAGRAVPKSKPRPVPKTKGTVAKRGSLLNFFGPEKGRK